MIGQEVRRRREDLGLTGAELAARSGLSPGAVSQIENGKRTPGSTTVMKLAQGLGVEVADLFPKKAQAPLFQELPDSATQEDRRPTDITVRMEAAELSVEGKPLTITVKREQVLRVLHEQGMSAEKADATWRELERLSA